MKKVINLFFWLKHQITCFGIVGFLRCIFSYTHSLWLPSKELLNPFRKKIIILTFSINPIIAQIWSINIQKFLDSKYFDFLIIDSSGQLKNSDIKGANIIYFPNIEHGKKIDFFMHRLNYKFVWVWDDDLFIIDSNIETDILEKIKLDNVFAISYYSRDQKIISKKNINLPAIGSYCVCFNRNVFLNENLSCQVKKTEDNNINWGRGYYDTCDFSQKIAMDLGYEIISFKHNSIVTFMGTSILYLKLKTSLNNFDKFTIDLLRFPTDWRRISGFIGSTYCLIKIYDLYLEFVNKKVNWIPPINETQLMEINTKLDNKDAKIRSNEYIKKYEMVYKLVRQSLKNA